MGPAYARADRPSRALVVGVVRVEATTPPGSSVPRRGYAHGGESYRSGWPVPAAALAAPHGRSRCQQTERQHGCSNQERIDCCLFHSHPPLHLPAGKSRCRFTRDSSTTTTLLATQEDLLPAGFAPSRLTNYLKISQDLLTPQCSRRCSHPRSSPISPNFPRSRCCRSAGNCPTPPSCPRSPKSHSAKRRSPRSRNFPK